MAGTDVSPGERLAIIAECSQLVAAYSYLMDHRQFDELADLLAEDGVVDNPFTRAVGRTAFRAYLDTRPFATSHVCSIPYFTHVAATEASCITYVTAFVGEGTEPGPYEVSGVAAVAEFHDSFRLVDGVWKFAHHTAKVAVSVKK